jgi:WS/DGAT/MGAT family acyltransferase
VQQLTGLDAAFLAMESANVQGHGGGVCVLRARLKPGPLTVDELRQTVRARLHRVPLFTSRLREVPLGLDQPYWIADTEPDLHHHIRECWLGPDASLAEVADMVATLHAQHLDRHRPLWELHLIHGLTDNGQAAYLKVHHAAIDGVSGNELLTALLDAVPNPDPPMPPPAAGERRPVHNPRAAELVGRTALSYLGHPRRLGALLPGLAGPFSALVKKLASLPQAPRVTGSTQDFSVDLTAGARAPATPFNRAIGPSRRLALRSVAFEDVLTVKRALGVTVNDVVLAMCAGALRHWLVDRDALPAGPLVAAVPVSTRVAGETAELGNKLTMMLASLPTHLGSPLDRVGAVHQGMRGAKDTYGAIPANLLADITRFAMPSLVALAFRLSARLRILERINPFNLIVSNVPGPRTRLFLAGAPVLTYYPVSQVVDGQGLNITVLSYDDGLHIGVLSDAQLVPDPDAIAALMAAELAILVDVALAGDDFSPAQR